MKCNIGKVDRMFRLTIGIIIILAGLYYESWWGAVGIVPIVTGSIRWCPAYDPFGFSTCETNKK
jgi:hypothetical protein